MNDPSTINREDVGVLASPEEVLTTLLRDGRRKWVYPEPSSGRHQRRRFAAAWSLILLFVALPVVRVGGYPAVLIDVVHREFAFFGLVLYPTDTLLLLLFLVGNLLGIILITALLGRVWCGWACPQTVYLEFVFRPIERWIEGREHVRRRRDEGPLNWDKAWRKAAKHALYLVLSVLLAHTFVAYFVGWEHLLAWLSEPPRAHWGFFVMMALTTGLVYFDFAFFREQMCTITCPYARIQSVLLDPDSLIVSYDASRGEPRGRGKQREALGDCVDCLACVRTCPTAIDIRDGLQMECIACTQCIDACDNIMDRVGKPRGLIRYTSERALEGRASRILRPRTLLYGALGAVILGLFVLTLDARGAYDVNIGRSVGAPYAVLPDGRVANRLRFRVRNQRATPTAFTLEAVAPEGIVLAAVGPQPTALAPGEMQRVEAWVTAPLAAFAEGRREATFRVRFEDGSYTMESFLLLGPRPSTR